MTIYSTQSQEKQKENPVVKYWPNRDLISGTSDLPVLHSNQHGYKDLNSVAHSSTSIDSI